MDVCAILTESLDAGAYWRKLKQRLKAEGGQPVTFCHGLKLQAPDRIDARLIAPIPKGWGPFAPIPWHHAEWLFALSDLIVVLTDSTYPRQYIKKCVAVTQRLMPTGVHLVPPAPTQLVTSSGPHRCGLLPPLSGEGRGQFRRDQSTTGASSLTPIPAFPQRREGANRGPFRRSATQAE